MGSKGTCKAEGCEKDVLGKGYCERHYRAWKRGKMPKPRYKRCNTEGCTKPGTMRHLCEVHFNSTYRKVKEIAASGEGSGQAPAASNAEASA